MNSSTSAGKGEGTTSASGGHLQQVLLRPLGVDETFGRLKDVFLQRWGFFLSIAAVAVILQRLLAWSTVTAGGAFRFPGVDAYTAFDDTDMFADYESMYEDVEDVAAEANGNDGGRRRRRWLEDAVAAYYGQQDADSDATPTMSLPLVLATIATFLVQLVLQYMIVAVSDGALIRTVAELYVVPSPGDSGRAPLSSARHVLAKAWGRIVPLVGTPLVLFLGLAVPASVLCFMIFIFVSAVSENTYGLVILLGLAYSAGACFVAIVTYHTYPIIMVENNNTPRGIIGSLKRSWELSAGHRGYIFCVMLLFVLIKSVLLLIVGAIVWTLGFNQYVQMVLDMCYGTLDAALGAILQAIVYFSVRAAKESLTIDMLAQELQMDTDTPYQSMPGGDMVTNHGSSSTNNNGSSGAAALDLNNKEAALV